MIIDRDIFGTIFNVAFKLNLSRFSFKLKTNIISDKLILFDLETVLANIARGQ